MYIAVLIIARHVARSSGMDATFLVDWMARRPPPSRVKINSREEEKIVLATGAPAIIFLDGVAAVESFLDVTDVVKREEKRESEQLGTCQQGASARSSSSLAGVAYYLINELRAAAAAAITRICSVVFFSCCVILCRHF